jgi:hypothetical protein
MKRASDETLQMVNTVLVLYGACLCDGEIIAPNKHPTGVYVTETKTRLQFRNFDGGILFSGSHKNDSVHKFVKAYWYWKTLEQQLANTRY